MGRLKAETQAIASGVRKKKPAGRAPINGPQKKETKRTGRPSTYSEEMADRICMLVATNPAGLEKIIKQNPDLPARETIYQWRYLYKNFADKYFEARREQAELMVAEIDDLLVDQIERYADDKGNMKIDPPSASLVIARANNRKWVASRMLPKLYGDKLEVERKESENEFLREQISELRKQLDKKNKKDY